MALDLAGFIIDGSLPDSGLRLDGFSIAGEEPTEGLVFPRFTLTEDELLSFSLTMDGGILFSGAAEIADNLSLELTMTGGILYSGEATVVAIFPSISYYFPLGGIRYSGTATVVNTFTEFTPSGGVRYSGTATVVSRSSLYEHEMTGGILYSGEAKDPLFYASGGILYSGTANVETVNIFTYAATGGVQYSGAADSYAALYFTPTGGINYAGTATVVYKDPVYVPSGGIEYSGEALSIFLPNGSVLTPENPYGDVFSGWALNYETAAASRYENLPMNSVCRFNGETLVANAAGIYRLGKTDDAGQPIKASATILSNTDFGSKANKRVPYIYMGYKSDYNMRITVQTNTQTYTYEDLLTPNDGNRGTRAVLGRGLRGLYWTFRISNIDGAFFELDNLYVYPVTLDRMGV